MSETEKKIAELVDRGIALERSMKTEKKELDGIKAELQSLALQEMENKNIKYVPMFGQQGNCEAVYKEKFEVDNYPLLVTIVGNLVKDKIVRKEDVKFEVDSRFKEALIALYKGHFGEHDIEGILRGLGLTDKQVKVAMKKIKGDYKKDKAFLNSLGVNGDLEEELDAIVEAKNLELIRRYFDLEKIDREELKRCIWVEDSLSISFSYNAEGGDGVRWKSQLA